LVFSSGVRTIIETITAVIQWKNVLCALTVGGEVLKWQKNYGGISSDYARSIVQTSDSGYADAGYTQSSLSGDVTRTIKGDFNLWIV